MMNVASIDIGSNTVLLLIAELDEDAKSFVPILNRYEMPRLGKGLDNSGNISAERIKILHDVLKQYANLIDEYNCSEVICTATNAMRVAENSSEIIDLVKKETGIQIETISGEREAELSFKGASSALPKESEKIVLDIGGGSSEIIYGVNNKLEFRKSFPIGAVNMTEKYIHSYPPPLSELENLKKGISNTFKEIESRFTNNTPLIAVAGTPTSLAAIVNGLTQYDEQIVEGFKLTKEKLIQLIHSFSKSTPHQILSKHGDIIKGREDVILAGSFILEQIIELTNNSFCTVSGKGIRYGSIVEYIERLD